MGSNPSGGVQRCRLTPEYSVPRIIVGGWQLSRGHRKNSPDPDDTMRDLRRLIDAGLNTFDCGDIYAGVETLLGKLLQSSGKIQVHTKFVPDREALPRLEKIDVEQVIDRSLRRLGVERLHMVQFHWWDYDVPGYVEAASWLDDLRRAGKIGLLGVTNFDLPHLAEIVDAGVPVVCHQLQYSLLDRRPERCMANYCREHGIQLLAYGTLAGGFLSQRYRNQPDPAPPLANRSLVKYRLMVDEFGGWPRLQELLETLAGIAMRHGVSIANVAVRWTMQRDGVAAAIVGAFNADHLDESLRLFAFELTADDLRSLDGFADAGPDGDVYAAERQSDGPHAAIMKYNLNRFAGD